MTTQVSDLMAVLDLLDEAGIHTWVHGGWGIDALIGTQTRQHKDIDLLVPIESAEQLRQIFRAPEWETTKDNMPVQLAFGRRDGVAVTFDLVTLDHEGGATQQLYEGDSWGSEFYFTPEGLSGEGTIGHRTVRCLTPELQVETHLGYEPDDGDRRDMTLLAERFAFPLPPPYGRGSDSSIRTPP
ncbi:MAG: hypothetical protein M3N53_06100 [Actinomycetota bacterium]|nr:hypothetical protein [Actinomycetota bacterium]